MTQEKDTCQEPQWSIKLYFEDATGAKDTLTIGYDPSAEPYTEIIDPQFDEDWEQIDTTKFNVYIQKFGIPGDTYPEWPPIDTDMVRKKSITSWPYPQDEFAWMHGQVPITMTWDEPLLDSPNLPAIFPNLEPYPRARMDIWLDAYWFECVFPDCESQNFCYIADPQPPLVILTSYTDFIWGMGPCVLSDFLIWESESGVEIDENIISIPSIIVMPFLDIPWMGIDENSKQSIKISPNPVTSILTLESNNILNTKYAIHDLLGKKYREGKLEYTKEQIYVETLPQGIYLLKIDYQTFKFIKL